MLSALEALATPEIDELKFAVAYVTYRGAHALVSRLARRVGQSRWRAIPKTAIATTDFHMTEPRALRYLRAEGFAVHLSSVRPANFHPKLYAFASGSDLDVLVGSANLTVAALSNNVEAGAVLRLGPSDWFDSSWDRLLDASVELTDEVLEDYSAQRRSAPPRIRPDRVVRAPRPIAATALVSFPEAVALGDLDPSQFDSLWVEAGSMRSGGSNNQLELPRGASRFFGFPEHEPSEHLFGYPVLFSGGREWSDRGLTWHAQGKMNQMERLNLPTRKEGGFDYAHMVILFTRVGLRYQLSVAEPGSPFANAWRLASRRARHEYGLGKRNSPRTCGLF